jgi:formylglycine-generating enzyme required for sulfatase activity
MCAAPFDRRALFRPAGIAGILGTLAVLVPGFACGPASHGADPRPAAPAEEKAGAATTLDLGNGVALKLVLVPAGRFAMGVPEDAPDRDKQDLPVREVVFEKAFRMGATEVTQAQYEAVMGENPSRSVREPQCPVDSVTPRQADEFCRKLTEKTGRTVRMPTEAEWEYAARAGGDGLGGARTTDVAWCQSNSEAKPHPVGTKAPNAWGLHDMLGNANEWARGEKWIGYRGGCWRTPERKCLPTHREGHGNLHNDPYGGFRVVVESR